MRRKLVFYCMFLLVAPLFPMGASPIAEAAPPEGFAASQIRAVWQRDDGQVAAGRTERTWMWGPGPFYTNYEPYREAQEGNHLVQYFDKGRLEINNPDGDKNSPWYVTSGLLVKEMVTGRTQVGDNAFYNLGSASVPIAGDSNDPNAPTYATFGQLTSTTTDHTGQVVDSQVDISGRVSEVQSPAPVKYAAYEQASGHNWADAFWNFVNSPQRPAAFNWLHMLGYPITEPYWVRTTISGRPQTVLVQLFERRSLTLNPSNPSATQVEMGNVGRHYYNWRYADTHQADLDALYDVHISVGAAPTRATHVEQTIAFTNNTGQSLDSVILHAVWRHWSGVFSLSSATVQDKAVQTRWRDGINLEISLAQPLDRGARAIIKLAFDLKPRPVGGRTGYDRANDILSLGDMLPTLVPWENGGWSYYPYSQLGDFGYYNSSNYNVEIVSTGGERLIVGGTGKITSVDDARTRWQFTARDVRDVAYVVSPHFIDPLAQSAMSRKQGGILMLGYFLPEHRAHGEKQLELVAGAFDWFGRMLGSYPFDTYTVAEMGVPSERTDNYAQEYPMAYFVPTTWLRLGIEPGTWTWYTPFHESGHQWFYSTIGNNQLTDPWLDEAMTSYIVAEYIRASFPSLYERSWNSISGSPGTSKPVSTGVYGGFASENEYSATVYSNGVRMLQRVRIAMGDSAFYAALQEYYQRFKFKRATPNDLLGLLQAHSNADLKPIISMHLAY